MQRVEMPNMALWNEIARHGEENHDWVRLTCPEDFQVPAAVADEALRRFTGESHRYDSIVSDERTLYARVVRDTVSEDVGTVLVHKWLELFTEKDPLSYLSSGEAWDSFREAWPVEEKMAAWMTKSRFENLLTKAGHPSESRRVGKRVLRVRPGLNLRDIPMTASEWREANEVPPGV